MPAVGHRIHNSVSNLCREFLDDRRLLREKCDEIEGLQDQVEKILECIDCDGTGSSGVVGPTGPVGNPGGNSQDFKFKIANCESDVPCDGEIMFKCENELLISCKNHKGEDISKWLDELAKKCGFFNLFKNGTTEQIVGCYEEGATEESDNCCSISCNSTCQPSWLNNCQTSCHTSCEQANCYYRFIINLKTCNFNVCGCEKVTISMSPCGQDGPSGPTGPTGCPGGNAQCYILRVGCPTPGKGEIVIDECDNKLRVSCYNNNCDDLTEWLRTLALSCGTFKIFENCTDQQIFGCFSPGAIEVNTTSCPKSITLFKYVSKSINCCYFEFDISLKGASSCLTLEDGSKILLDMIQCGPTGPTGPAGPTGPTGLTGPTGVTGLDGCPGGNSQPFLYLGTLPSCDVPNGGIGFFNDGGQNKLVVSSKSCTDINLLDWLECLSEDCGFFNLFVNCVDPATGALQQIVGSYEANSEQIPGIMPNCPFFKFCIDIKICDGTIPEGAKVYLSMSTCGPVGPTGPTGPTGPIGPTGPVEYCMSFGIVDSAGNIDPVCSLCVDATARTATGVYQVCFDPACGFGNCIPVITANYCHPSGGTGPSQVGDSIEITCDDPLCANFYLYGTNGATGGELINADFQFQAVSLKVPNLIA